MAELNLKLQRTIYDLQTFTSGEKLVLLCVLALFLPFQYAAVAIALLLLIPLSKGELWPAILKQRGAKWFYAFVILEIAVSTYYKNWIGLLNAGGYLLVGFFVAYYRKELNPKLFNYVVHIMVFMSLFEAVWGCVEFYRISTRNGFDFFDFVIANRPKDRINGTFMNAAFYGTMIDFFLIFCCYEFLRDKNINKRVYYLTCAAINFFMLILTGTRGALLPLIFIIPVFLWFHKKKTHFWICVTLELIVGILILFNPEVIPRFEDLGTVNSRVKIWHTALLGIAAWPLFGQGPQTYGNIYKLFNGHKAPHAHNVYLDVLLSFGIVGTALLGGYTLSLLKEIFSIYNYREEKLFFPMIICFVLVALVQGLVDNTLNFLVTGTTFALVLNSACMYSNPRPRRRQFKLFASIKPN